MKQIFMNEIKNLKPAVIDWLIEKFNLNIKYEHSFKDQWISVNIWDGQLTISFDTRQPEQVQLFNALPAEIKGTKQHGTGKMVNLQTLYFDMNKEFTINYPEIKSKEIVGKVKHTDNDGDTFYVYSWLVKMNDETEMIFTNQDNNKLDIEKWIYPTRIQERFLTTTLCGGILKV